MLMFYSKRHTAIQLNSYNQQLTRWWRHSNYQCTWHKRNHEATIYIHCTWHNRNHEVPFIYTAHGGTYFRRSDEFLHAGRRQLLWFCMPTEADHWLKTDWRAHNRLTCSQNTLTDCSQNRLADCPQKHLTGSQQTDTTPQVLLNRLTPHNRLTRHHRFFLTDCSPAGRSTSRAYA